ncbi:MAG: energy transducer TonB [Muribaculaceae bacterium]|nr:energy transducer TonB [Muribaculaceae bacterium]
MAKDVDLSSREWLDLVFEGKNKDFGAYELRSESPKRHNLAVIVSLTAIALATLGGWGWIEYNEYQKEKLLEEERLRQEALEREREKMEEIEVDEVEYIEPEKEEVIPEDVQNSQKVTEFNIVADDLVKEPPTAVDALKEDDRAVGSKDEDKGTDDITKETVKVEEIVVPEPKKEEKKEEPKPEPKPKEEEVFKSAAHMPSFPGGDAALMSFINKNIKYPQVAQDNGVQGKVIVQFVVEKNGKVGEVKVARGVDKDLDREAVRVCKMLPAFSPGRNAVGDPVRVWYTLPVQFKLQGVN